MTPKEFVFWMRGFVTASPKFHPTPEQWDLLVDQLKKVDTEIVDSIITAQFPSFENYCTTLSNDKGIENTTSKNLIKG
jgi:hypothetical protein